MQKEIAKAFKKETNSDFKVKINSFWGTNIAQGEFSELRAVSKNYADIFQRIEELVHYQAGRIPSENYDAQAPYKKLISRNRISTDFSECVPEAIFFPALSLPNRI